MHSRIVGTGSYLPAQVLTNAELAQRVDTSDEWIRTRTGIRQRHLAAPGETTSDLALAAAREALTAASLAPAAVDMIVLDRKSTRLNSSHRCISYAVFC